MKVLIFFKNGKQVERQDVLHIFVHSRDNELCLMYGPFSSESFNLADVSFYNVEI